MKIVICNVPLRPEESKTNYPPLGVLAVIQALQSAGHNADFYDINFFRPTDEEIRNYFLKNKFDIAGISATVSTSYRFAKKLVSIIKSVSPETIVVVGGALTASSEILLKFSTIDFCIIGEGEKSTVNLINYISSQGMYKSEEELRKIKGLCFLNGQGDIVFTGHEKQLTVDEIQDADYRLIERYSSIDQYITHSFFYEQFRYDDRSFQEHRRNKKLATVVSSRGCINRCTFCYRWQKGIRIFPVERVIRHIKYLIENYNVGFISFGDENFGVTKNWLEEFTERIRPLDILYRVAGICCENINPSSLRKLRESGCVAVHYGFESGSNKMLKVIEKRADAELNVKVARWTHNSGVQTVPALVVGMPGESYDTIRETTDFVKKITEFWPRDPVISVNALVTLPGTPVYEYARYKGFLGKTLADEEKYLLAVSDQSGASFMHLNLTDYPYFIVLGWIRCICWVARYNYYKKHNFLRMPAWKLFWTTLQIIFKRRKIDNTFLESLYGNPIFYHLRHIIAPLDIMYKNYKVNKRLFLERFFELLIWPFKKKTFTKYISLRNFLHENVKYMKNIDPEDVQILRLGR